MKIRIGTRGSNLAVVQTTMIKTALEKMYPNREVELKIIKTSGDRILDRPISQVGTKGVFVQEIEEALLHGEIDLAVHSMKDMPGEETPGLIFAAPPKGEDPRDALIFGRSVADLHDVAGALIGTGSLRRKFQLRELIGDVRTKEIRGNIETRMGKIESGEVDGVILAAAGLLRAGHFRQVSYLFSVEEMIPAPCQGILALQVNGENQEIIELLRPLADETTSLRMETERAFQRELNAGCHSPMGVHAIFKEDRVRIRGCFGDEENGIFLRKEISGSIEDRIPLAKQLAQDLREVVYG